MPTKKVTIIPFKKSVQVLSGKPDDRFSCYYLSDNYGAFVDLRKKFGNVINIKNLSGVFDRTFQELKETVLESLSGLNKKYDSYAWWGGMLASKSTSSSPLILNITYLFCAKKILSEEGKDVVFIVDSPALSTCIADMAEEQGFHVALYKSTFSEWGRYFKRRIRYSMQIASYFLKIVQRGAAARKAAKPMPPIKPRTKKRIILRSWVTTNGLKNPKDFQDRNFGQLPAWLRSQGYEVWILPMFFNISTKSIEEIYTALGSKDQMCLIPEHYLKITDYLGSLHNGYKVFTRNIDEMKIEGTEVAPLLNEVLKDRGFDVGMCLLNLNCSVMGRIKQLGFEVDRIYYAFENSASEKQFVLACKQNFPDVDIVGYQHTAFYPNQLAHHLAPGEGDFHPLPDKIICSSPGYLALHKKARFSPEILEDGPNLRFKDVYLTGDHQRISKDFSNEKILLLPLTFSYDLAFELFIKVQDALRDTEGYRVYIRTHPLLSKNNLEDFLNRIEMNNYQFADEGIIQEWLPKTYAVVSTGGTIVILEAIAFGTPVIRVIPDNTFYYDPFPDADYPLEPVNTSSGIRDQLRLIKDIQSNGKKVFGRFSKQVLSDYFPEPNEENLKVFL